MPESMFAAPPERVVPENVIPPVAGPYAGGPVGMVGATAEAEQINPTPEATRDAWPRATARQWYKKLNPGAAIGMFLIHAGCLLAVLVPFHWSQPVLALFLWWVCGGLGICLCYHRLLTHKSFETYKWFRYLLTALGASSLEGGPIKWVGTHRIHHAESDGPEDPHTPEHGFNWAHIWWAIVKDNPDRPARNAAKDLQRDPMISLIDKWAWVPAVAILLVVGVAGYLVFGTWQGAVGWVAWGVFIRTVFVYHATWFVNSASHTWGYRNYETSDDSRNNWWVALLSFGEGWHNNHHADQRSAAHGHKWYEVDLTYITIKVLSWVGLAWDVKEPKGMA